MLSRAAVAALLKTVLVVSAWEYEERFSCLVCEQVSLGVPCEAFGACHSVNASTLQENGGCCARAGLCNISPDKPAPHTIGTTTAAPDIRVTKGFGTKPYNSVRVSVITQGPPDFDTSKFDYTGPFKYKWTQNHITSTMTTVPKPGIPTTITVGNTSVDISIPPQGKGVAGLLFGDPCVEGGSFISLVGCTYAKEFQTSTRTPEMINTFLSHNDLDFWGVLGDNFYDRNGDLSAKVFAELSTKAKSKIMVTVPGNHDYWITGEPFLGTHLDQYGNGHMQWYAQDSKASEDLLPNQPSNKDQPPFNYSIDPQAGHIFFGGNLAALENHFWYNQMGNVGMVGYSGAHPWQQTLPYVQEACEWLHTQFESGSMEVAVLFGHWDVDSLGAAKEMDTPSFYDLVKEVSGCKELDGMKRLKFFMGHTHCNTPHPHGKVNTGFMVAGQGMIGCGNYGWTILDTTEERIRVWYFEVVSKPPASDTYAATQKCVAINGWRNCTHLATLWLDQPFRNSTVRV